MRGSEFMLIYGDSDDERKEVCLVNAAQVRTARFVDGRCELSFSEAHSLNVGGPAALEVFLALLEGRRFPTEEIVAETVAAVRSRFSSSASVTGPDRE